MKIILLENVKKLGRKGEVVSVKPGYARNYLVNEKKALYFDPSLVSRVAVEQSHSYSLEDQKIFISNVRSSLENMVLLFKRSLAPSGKFYASVSLRHVVDELAQQVGLSGIDVSHFSFTHAVKIKVPGFYHTVLSLYDTDIPFVCIVADSDESLSFYQMKLKEEQKAQEKAQAASKENVDDIESILEAPLESIKE